MTKALIAVLIALGPAAALAEPQIRLTGNIEVVTTRPGPDGKPVVVYDAPKLITPGDRLSLSLNWANGSGRPAEHFSVTDPIPAGLAFAGNASPGAEMSVDGGKTFGPLDRLTLAGPDGKPRSATGADVTHVRWNFARQLAPGERGQLRFDAIVK
jgi:uncharacterized repeat protein (TIGR01451 family)